MSTQDKGHRDRRFIDMPISPVPSLADGPVRLVYDFEADSPVYSSFGVPTRSLRLYECAGSGIRFRVPASPEDVARLHDHDYHVYYRDNESALAAAHGENMAGRIQRLLRHVTSGNALDVGCSTCLWMKALEQAGFTAYGCDVVADVCDAARRLFPSERICCGNVAQGRKQFGDGRFDLVTAMDVIEHFDNAAEGLRDIHALLRPGGTLFLRVPDGGSPFFRIADWSHKLSGGRYTRAALTIYHAEHIYYFTRKGMRMLLEETGFEVVETLPDPLPWRSFRLAELCHGPLVNMALALVYGLMRLTGQGHGMLFVARRVNNDGPDGVD